MSASREPDISDIHTTTVETFSVSNSDSSAVVHPIDGVRLSNVDVSVPQSLTGNVTVHNDPVQSPISNVGASISVGGDGSSSVGAMTDRASSAFLSIASNSLNLTEILNAQQQALEQFQCQLQLAQQTEAINQRLDAIERTLSSLIQQKAQEEVAAKSSNHHHSIHHHHHHHQPQPSPPSPPPPQQQEVDDLQVQAQVQLSSLSASPLQTSQQLQISTTADSVESAGEKKTKLPRELCVSCSVIISFHLFYINPSVVLFFFLPRATRAFLNVLAVDLILCL